MKIRKAMLKDAAIISQIVCYCYEGFGQTDKYPKVVIIELKKIRGATKCIEKLITNENVFVADDIGSIKGMISINDNEITKLFVNPHCQRKGIGKMLFTHAEMFIRSLRHQYMFLGAAAQTPVPFYERMGMRISRKRTINCGPCIGMTSIILEKTFGTAADKPRS